MDNINACLNEILTDENGNTTTPSCGIEKLLCLLCENMGTSAEITAITNDEIDEITS